MVRGTVRIPELAYWLSVVGLFLSTSALANSEYRLLEYTISTWSERHGLPSGQIRAIVEDREGYLWLGTAAGLVKFDGSQFSRFRARPGSPTLPEAQVAALHVARDGSLWVGFGGSGSISRVVQGRVLNYTSAELPKGIRAILEDRAGTLWVGAHDGLWRLEAGGHWERLGTRQGLPAESVNSLLPDRRGRLWVGTSTNLFRLDLGASVFLPVLSRSQRVNSVSEDVDGDIWLTDPRCGFRELSRPRGGAACEGRLGAAPGNRLVHDRDGALWVGTLGAGLLRVSRSATGLTVDRFTSREGLAGDVVLSLFVDREGNVWAGTQSGLTRLSRRRLRVLVNQRDGRLNFIRSVTATRDGVVWAGTPGGLLRIRNDGRVQVIRREQGLPSADTFALYADQDGALWVATDGGLARVVGDRVVRLASWKKAWADWVVAMALDRAGKLWLCDINGVVIRLAGGAVEVPEVVKELTVARRKVASVVSADRRGTVWIGFTDGTIANVLGERADLYSAGDGRIYAISEDRAGTVWVGTEGGLWKLEGRKFVKAPLPFRRPGDRDPRVTALAWDSGDFLWLAIDGVLARLSLSEAQDATSPGARSGHQPEVTIYDATDGLPTSLSWLAYPTVAQDSAGRLWFASGNGLVVAAPTQAGWAKDRPAVRITAVRAGGEEIFPGDGLRLPWSMARLQIDYGAATLNAVERIEFRYRLDNFDSEWVEAREGRSAVYTRLPPGHYRFRVAAARVGEPWGDGEKVWSFVIEPPFYRTGLFYGFCVVLAASAVGAGLWLRLREVRKHFELVASERARMSHELHDTLLQSLAGVALQLDAISSEVDGWSPSVAGQLNRLRGQMERCIRETRESIWDLRSPLRRWNLATRLREVAEAVVPRSGARLEFSVHPEKQDWGGDVDAERQLLRVGQELLTNAARHSKATLVRVSLIYDDGWVTLRVEDDGVGFEPAFRSIDGSHWGLLIAKERVQRLGGRFCVRSAPGEGTTVEVEVPFRTKRGGQACARGADSDHVR